MRSLFLFAAAGAVAAAMEEEEDEEERTRGKKAVLSSSAKTRIGPSAVAFFFLCVFLGHTLPLFQITLAELSRSHNA